MDQVFYSQHIEGEFLHLKDQEAAHCVLVLRKKPGDRIVVIDGSGNRYTGVIDKVSKRDVECQIIKTEHFPLPTTVTLAVAPTKNRDRLEWMIEKVVEIGVKRIVLMSTQNSERHKVNTERLYKKAIAATKQSLRVHLPEIVEMKFSDVLSLEAQTKRIAHCREDQPRGTAKSKEGEVLLLIGPEGDFTSQEIDEAIAAGFIGLDLGQFRLRTETAAIVATALYQ